MVHEPAEEPTYELVTSRSPGESRVWISVTDEVRRWRVGFGGTGAQQWFSALEFEAAVSAGRGFAQEGFDVGGLPERPPIEVLIPEAVRRDPRAELAATRRREAIEASEGLLTKAADDLEHAERYLADPEQAELDSLAAAVATVRRQFQSAVDVARAIKEQ